jgi:hypothetical protein
MPRRDIWRPWVSETCYSSNLSFAGVSSLWNKHRGIGNHHRICYCTTCLNPRSWSFRVWAPTSGKTDPSGDCGWDWTSSSFLRTLCSVNSRSKILHRTGCGSYLDLWYPPISLIGGWRSLGTLTRDISAGWDSGKSFLSPGRLAARYWTLDICFTVWCLPALTWRSCSTKTDSGGSRLSLYSQRR